MGPAPIREALKEGATTRTADCASSWGDCTKFVSKMWTKLEVGDGGLTAVNFGRITENNEEAGSCPCTSFLSSIMPQESQLNLQAVSMDPF